MKTTNFIGDIHGHASELKLLLERLGYEKKNKIYRHTDSSIHTVFVGDYIDRGPEIPEVLEIVRRMVNDGSAIALMGNHEYNAICYNSKNDKGQYLRPHTDKNQQQHKATLEQFKGMEGLYMEYVEWFKTLPLWMETKSYRAVHACWDQKSIDTLKPYLEDRKLTEEALIISGTRGTRLYDLVETTLKGKELPLPDGIQFHDKDGHPRHDVRIKWWIQPQGHTYQDMRMNLEYDVPDVEVDPQHALFTSVYPKDERPVFFGHYWLRDTPNLHQDNICCLDYSVAKGGHLACYQYSGESKLDNDNFVFV